MTNPAIQVWKFDKAPEQYRKLHTGDDVDWLALVPFVVWLECDREIEWAEGGRFSPCGETIVHELPSGDVVLIGAHS
jgi:hypothetical protein